MTDVFAGRRGAIEDIRLAALPMTGSLDDYGPLLDLVGDAQLVLIGEASHGTHEFYRERAQITKLLIEQRGFCAICAEADWPDAYRVNRYVRFLPPSGRRRADVAPPVATDASAIDALGDFTRFPTWMWRNADVVDFVGWLRAHNERLGPTGRTVGFYGLDLYSLHSSIDAVVTFLDNVGQLTRERYGDTARLIGFTTYSGTVSAAQDWDEPVQRRRVRPALAGSYELLFHQTEIPRFLLPLRGNDAVASLREPRLERAIGVIYRPETERISHYFFARLPAQFDAVIHIDETRAVEPLEHTSGWEAGEPPETFPFAV